MKSQLTTNEWISFIGKEKLQSFQEAFSKMTGIGLCFLDLDGENLTVWSQSPLFCHNVLEHGKSRCEMEWGNAIATVKSKKALEVFHCFSGVLYFMCPVYFNKEMVAIAIGAGMASEDSYLPEEVLSSYHVTIISRQRLRAICDVLEKLLALLDLNIGNLDVKADTAEKNLQNDIWDKKLSKREQEVANLVCQGMSNKKIADKLFISEKTVKSHLSNILLKLDLSDRTQIIIKYCNLIEKGKA